MKKKKRIEVEKRKEKNWIQIVEEEEEEEEQTYLESVSDEKMEVSEEETEKSGKMKKHNRRGGRNLEMRNAM